MYITEFRPLTATGRENYAGLHVGIKLPFISLMNAWGVSEVGTLNADERTADKRRRVVVDALETKWVGVGVGDMMARGGGRQKKMLMNAIGSSEGSGKGKVILKKCMRADRGESNIDECIGDDSA